MHYCDNETADGLEFQFTPKVANQPLIVDVSSNFLTRNVDWSKIDILYSHGQKNVGIAGSSITIIRDSLLKPE
jgi:phosphoserine aminotransferase